MDFWEVWDDRLRRAKGCTFALLAETAFVQLDDHARQTGPRVVLPAGTKVEYVETTYDAMRLDQCLHKMKVVTGPAAGSWVGLADVAGPGPMPWEQ